MKAEVSKRASALPEIEINDKTNAMVITLTPYVGADGRTSYGDGKSWLTVKVGNKSFMLKASAFEPSGDWKPAPRTASAPF